MDTTLQRWQCLSELRRLGGKYLKRGSYDIHEAMYVVVKFLESHALAPGAILPPRDNGQIRVASFLYLQYLSYSRGQYYLQLTQLTEVERCQLT